MSPESPTLPSLEIVLCTYNNAPSLDRALAAIARQRVPAGLCWSVLVVDNNCTDETPAVVRRHARAGAIPSLRRVVELTQGLTPARVRGVKESTADWVAFVDDDCMLAEDWLEQALRFAAAHPRCGAFGGRICLAWEVPPTPLALRYRKAYSEQDYGPTPRMLPQSRPYQYLAGAGLIVRRRALMASGWLREQLLLDRQGARLLAGGDAEINIRVLKAGYQLWYTPACVLDHHIPERRMSERYLVDLFQGIGAGSCRMILTVIHASVGLKLLSCAVRALRGVGGTGLLLMAGLFQARARSDFRIQKGHLQGFLGEFWPSFHQSLAPRKKAARP